MFEAFDAQITSILNELKTKQDAAHLKNKKYAQLYGSHDAVPDGVSLDVKTSMVRDENILPTLPTKLPFAFRVDEYVGPTGEGWVLGVWAVDKGVTYCKWFAFGPDASSYSSEWVSTWDKLMQTYGGP